MCGEKRNAFKILEGKPEGKRPLRCTWKDSINMYLEEIGWESVGWIHLYRLVADSREHSSIKCWKFPD
jgi:hypothetical protein